MLGLLRSGNDIFTTVVITLLFAGVVIFSVSLHEFAHAFIAYENGDSTAKAYGRMTLNPMKHFDVYGFLMFFLIGFGFAKPVPVNPNNFRKLRRGIFTVAIAGVTMNLALAIVFSFFTALIYSSSTSSELLYILYNVFFIGARLNIALIVFNLIPVFPLDGFRVVESFAKSNSKYVNFMRQYGYYILIGLIIWGFIIDLLSGYFPYAASVLQYLDVLGFVINFLTTHALNLLYAFWGLFGLGG